MTKKRESEPEITPEVEKLHGLAFYLAKELAPGEGGEEFAPFSEEVLGPVAQFFLELTEEEGGTDELIHAAKDIAAFAIAHRKTSPTMSGQVSEMLRLPYVEEAVKKWSISADPEDVKDIAARFGDFAGVDAQKRAPQVGEEKPEGAVDLNALNFPKRL
jgi:hypothetical protein